MKKEYLSDTPLFAGYIVSGTVTAGIIASIVATRWIRTGTRGIVNAARQIGGWQLDSLYLRATAATISGLGAVTTSGILAYLGMRHAYPGDDAVSFVAIIPAMSAGCMLLAPFFCLERQDADPYRDVYAAHQHENEKFGWTLLKYGNPVGLLYAIIIGLAHLVRSGMRRFRNGARAPYDLPPH